jgi:hypothetical protein
MGLWALARRSACRQLNVRPRVSARMDFYWSETDRWEGQNLRAAVN